MKIQATQKLITEDFPDQKDWIGRLFYVVNRFITEVISIMNGNVVFGDNIAGIEKTIEFTYTITNTFPVGFKWGLSTKPQALSLVSALEDNAPIIALCSWEYTETGAVNLTKVVKINSTPAVSDLTVNSRYKIKVRVTP